MDLEPPYGNCSTKAKPVSHCIANCSTVKAERSCHCKDTVPDKTMETCDILGTLCIIKRRGKEFVSFYFRRTVMAISDFNDLEMMKHLASFLFIALAHQAFSTRSCNCTIPCTKNNYDATISNSLFDVRKLRSEIMNANKSHELLPNFRQAIEVSQQVCPITVVSVFGVNLALIAFTKQ